MDIVADLPIGLADANSEFTEPPYFVRKLRARAHSPGYYAQQQQRYRIVAKAAARRRRVAKPAAARHRRLAAPAAARQRRLVTQSPFWESLLRSLGKTLSFRARGPPHRSDKFQISSDDFQSLANRYGFTRKWSPGAHIFEAPPIPLPSNKLHRGYWLVNVRLDTFEAKLRQIKPKPLTTRISHDQPFIVSFTPPAFEFAYQFNKLEFSIKA
jgi:hypothetical protein